MAGKKRSTKKRIRQTGRRTLANTLHVSAARTAVRSAREIIAHGDPNAARDAIARVASELDRAAKSGAIHRNAAARRKSRIARAAAKARQDRAT